MPAPTDEALQAVLHAIIAGLMKLLMRRGVPAEEQEGSGCWLVDSEADPELARSLGPLQRLAALVPRPRLHLIRFHGVLAPNAKLRARVVPHGSQQPYHGGSEPQRAAEPACTHRGSARTGWARLLKRVFEIDLDHCPDCGGALKIIAVIMQAAGELPPSQAIDLAASGLASPAERPKMAFENPIRRTRLARRSTRSMPWQPTNRWRRCA